MKKEWMRDLEEESVDREGKFDVKERVELSDIGDTVEVTFLSEPRKNSKEDTRFDRDMFVAYVDNGLEWNYKHWKVYFYPEDITRQAVTELN